MSSALWRMWPIVADGTNAELWTTVLGREGSRPREFAPDQWETLERDAAPAWAAISHVPTTESFNPLALVDTKSPEDLAEVAKLWEEFGESRGRLVPRDAAGVDESARTAMLQELSPSGMIWAVEAAPGTTLQVLASWSPGWHASIDGGDWTPVRRVEKSRHLMEVPLPPGAREIRLEFSVPGLWRAVAFSLFGYLLSILSILLISRSRKRNTIP